MARKPVCRIVDEGCGVVVHESAPAQELTPEQISQARFTSELRVKLTGKYEGNAMLAVHEKCPGCSLMGACSKIIINGLVKTNLPPVNLVKTS